MEIKKIKKLIDKGYSQRRIAKELGIGQTTLRHWLKKYRLKTDVSLRAVTIKKCLNCGSVLKKSKRNPTKKYCNNSCQREYEWKLKKERIEKGEELPFRTMKKYLIEEYGNKCMHRNCGWDWSKPCNVDLEHKDGNSTNNDLKNLMLLCPNCHSLTKTYKGKNRGNGRHFRRQRYKDGKSY